MIITIDGPVASGKSSVARLVAMQLHCYYIHSGLLFRGLAYLLIHNELYNDNQLLNPLSQHVITYLNPSRFVYTYDTTQGKELILFDEIDITPYLQDKVIGKAASFIGKNVFVREKINAIQKDIAQQRDVVVEGRDAGSVVFADAKYKFYLDAPIEIRAQRWLQDKKRSPKGSNLQQALAYISERDANDRKRKVAPLKIPVDAIVISTEDKSVADVVKHIVAFVKKDNQIVT